MNVFFKAQPETGVDLKAPEDQGSFQEKRDFFQKIGEWTLSNQNR